MENKLFPVLGDVTKLRLGLSDEDYNLLVQNVTIVFHVAASVRFDEPMKDATIMNVRGTREVVLLAKQIKNLAVSEVYNFYRHNIATKCIIIMFYSNNQAKTY